MFLPYFLTTMNLTMVFCNDKSSQRSTLLACLYESAGRAIAVPLASALGSVSVLAVAALTKKLKFYVKVFKTSYFLNPQMD